MLKLLMLTLVAVTAACTSPARVDRTPAAGGAGAAGAPGRAGGRGARGRDGALVLANGCADLATQTLALLHDSEGVHDWEPSGTITHACGDAPDLGAATLSELHALVDQKRMNLFAAGYGVGSRVGPDLRLDWIGLLAKIAELKTLYRAIEEAPSREYGCVDGRARSAGRDRGLVRACFRADAAQVENDGTVLIDARMTATTYADDGTLGSYRTFEERSRLKTLPVPCANGVPRYEAANQGTSAGQRFTHLVRSNCDGFASTYTATYPDLEIRY